MNKQLKINTLLSRPRFKIYTDTNIDNLILIIKKQLEKNSNKIGGYANKEFAMIRLRKDKRKYWAPQVQIRWEQEEENKNYVAIRGVIGPKPTIWTFFMFLYGLSGTATVIFACIALSNYLVTKNVDYFFYLPITIGIGVLTYIASKIGQKIAKSHLIELDIFLNKILNEINFVEKLK